MGGGVLSWQMGTLINLASQMDSKKLASLLSISLFHSLFRIQMEIASYEKALLSELFSSSPFSNHSS